ncbi:MAG: family 16 glycoside hydrolase [Limisphaerales bacterium]
MPKLWAFVFLIISALGAAATELPFDWNKVTPGQMPPGFLALTTGSGNPSPWSVLEEAVPPTLAPLTSFASNQMAKQSVLEVQSLNMDKSHFSVLLYTNEIFYDFTLSTRFKINGGIISPEAGLVFRAQDQSNYYVLRGSTDGNLLWFRVAQGKSFEGVGVGVKIGLPKDTWQELKVDCSGSRIRCYLNGQLVIPPGQPGAPTNDLAINDTTFPTGKVGFWSRADTKCFFTDALVHYTPKVPFVQVVVAEIDRKYPRLLGLRVYADKAPGQPVVVGAKDEHDVGVAGTKYEQDVIDRSSMYYLKDSGTVEVTMPLHDRNGEVVAALMTKMKSFPGETKANAVARAAVIKLAIEKRLETLQDVLQ